MSARRRSYSRRRVCRLCEEERELDYKDVKALSEYVTDRKKIATRRSSRFCARHQRRMAIAIKRARFMALLPYTVLH